MFFLTECKCSNWEDRFRLELFSRFLFFEKERRGKEKTHREGGSDSPFPVNPTPKRLRDLASL